MGSALLIRDLTEWPEHRHAVYYPTDTFSSQDEKFLEVMNELLGRVALWTIAQAFEIFGTFLYDSAAALLHAKPSLTKKIPASVSAPNINYWKDFVRNEYRRNDELFKYLRKVAPNLAAVEQNNNRIIDLTDWYSVIAEVRHATTHAGFVIKNPKFQQMSVSQQAILNDYFVDGSAESGYVLKADVDNVYENLRLLAEYGFAIFKSLSQEQGYIWDILPKSL